MIEQKFHIRNLIVVAVIAEIFSTFTLWIIEIPIKYPLFIIETFSVITIYVILSNYDVRFTLKNIITKRISPAILLDLTLIYFSSILILLNVFKIEDSTIKLILAFVCTSGLSGCAFLNVCRLTKYFSKLEIVVLSFLASFILSGFCALVLLWVDETTRSVIISSVFISLGIASSIKHLKFRHIPTIKIDSLSKNIDILAIALCIAFYAVFFYYVYPNFTLQSANDILRHYQLDLQLSRTPDLYNGFNYILFHAYGSTLNILSGAPDTTSFLTIQIIISFFLPISVYIFAKRFLADIDRRIPAISIVFYTILSNLSFIYFTYLKVSGSKETEFNLLANSVAEKTYDGTIYFLQPFPWVVPSTVALIMFIVAFILLRVWSLPRSKFIPLYTVLILATYLTHVADAPLLVIIIGIYSMISKSKSLRFDDALLSSLIAFILAAIFLVYTSVFWPSLVKDSGITLLSMLPVIVSILLISISMFWRRKILYKISTPMFWRRKILYKISTPMKFIGSKKFYQVLSAVLVTIYLLGLLTWFFDNNFQTSQFTGLGSVPWFIYPLSLGIVGLLALVTILHMGQLLPNSSVAILFGSILIMFLFGSVISFVNINYFFTGYFEKRFMSDIFLFACLLAPIPLVKLMDQINVKRKFFTNIGFSTLISLIIFLGFSSMVLQSDFWAHSAQSNIIKPEWVQATNYLKNIFQHEHRAFVITTSSSSNNVLVHAAPPYQFSQPDVVLYSKNPEIPLFSLSAHDLTHAYIYMPIQTLNALKGKESWLINHLLPTLPVVFSNDEVMIYNATHVSYPRSNSDTTMIVPSDLNAHIDSFFYAYDVISKHDRNYTVMLDRDQNALKSKTVVLSYDPPENNNHYDFYDKFSSLNNWKIISGNWKASTDGLHGGKTLETANQIILSPISSKNFTLDTSFRIIDANQTLPNYVTIIYSWTDTKNYETAQIAFLSHHVYVSYINVREGQTFNDPAWPGKATGLSWAPGNLFNFTFSKQGQFEDLFLNGTKYLHREYVGNSGYIGLGTGRVHDVIFDHISIHNLGKLNLRDSSDYISYVKSGGNLVLLNTNGYHSISKTLFNMTITSYEASKIVMPSGDYLPVNATIFPLSAGKNVMPLAFYSSSANKSSILVASKTVGLGKITYVNIFPVISSFNENKTSATTFQKILDKTSDLIGLQSINYLSQKNNIDGNFDELTVYGNATIKTASLVFPDNQLMKIIIQSNNKEISIANATNLNIIGYHNATLQGNNTLIANGKGLYGNLDLGQSIKIFFDGDATLEAISNNNKSYHFDNVSNIFIQNNNKIHVYAWQPDIKVSGYTYFKNLWGARCLTNNFFLGTNYYMPGNVSLTLLMSDTTTYFSCMESPKTWNTDLESLIR